MAIEFIQLNTASTSGARIAADLVSAATPSDNVYYQTIQLVKGADSAAKTLITSGAGLPVIIDATATIQLSAGTATIGSVHVTENTATSVLGGGTATIGSVHLTDSTATITLSALPAGLATIGVVGLSSDVVLAAGTATIGFVQISETTATTVLGGSTATIGDVRLRSASGGSLSTDGVLKTDAGTPVLAAGTATVGSVHVSETTATYTLGPGTATIGSVVLTSPTGASLTTDGVLKSIMVESTATHTLGGSTATIGFVRLSETTATTVLGGGTATIGSVILTSPTGASLTTDAVLKMTLFNTATVVVNTINTMPALVAGTASIGNVHITESTATITLSALPASTATIGFVKVSETTATTVLGGSTATIGDVRLRSASGGSLSTDGVLKTDAGTPVLAGGTATIGSVHVTENTATTALGGSTATIGFVRLSETTATTILGGSTATIGRIGGFFTTTGGSIEDGDNDALRVNLVAGGAAGGTSQTDAATLTSGSTAFTPVGGFYQNTRDVLASGTGGLVQQTVDRALLTSPETPSGGNPWDGSNLSLNVNLATSVPAGTATIGSVVLGQGTATVGTILTITTMPALTAGTASIGNVHLTESTATVTLSPLPASTATIGSILNVNNLAETTATYTLGPGTATIGSIVLTSPTGASLTTDGVLKSIMVESTATHTLGGSTATVGFVRLSETTATTVLGIGTATIGSILNVNNLAETTATYTLGPGTSTVGFVKVSETTATTILGAGTATVGSVALSSGTATVGTFHAVIDGYGIGTATGGRLVPKFASIEFTAANANETATIVAAVAGAKIRPISYVLAAQGTANIQWTSATTVILSGFMALASQTGIAANFNPFGHMETVTGVLLGIRSSVSGITIAGHVCYVEATT